MARRIVVQFIGDARSLNRATDSAGDATTRLSDRMRAVAKVAGFALAAGAVMAAKGLYSATKAAIADSAAQAKLAQGLKNAAGANDAQVAATERWISAQGRALGVTDDELRPALSRLVTATKDVEEAQRLAALSMDVSAGSGKSLESVSTAMMKAANGNVSALSRLGINTKNAAGETISFPMSASAAPVGAVPAACRSGWNFLKSSITRPMGLERRSASNNISSMLAIVTSGRYW